VSDIRPGRRQNRTKQSADNVPLGRLVMFDNCFPTREDPLGVHVNGIRHESCQLQLWRVHGARGKNAKLNEGGMSDWLRWKKLHPYIHKSCTSRDPGNCHILFICDRGLHYIREDNRTRDFMSHESKSWVWCSNTLKHPKFHVGMDWPTRAV